MLKRLSIALLASLPSVSLAQSPMVHPECPTVNEPCRILYLSPQEEQLLTGKNGILDTAAQGRAIELGGFAVYFKQKIATSIFGEVKSPPPAETKPDKQPVDKP